MSLAQGPPQRQHHPSRCRAHMFGVTGGGNTTGVIALSALFSSWTLPDVVNYIFHLVWVCGIPVHYRYVVHLLYHIVAVRKIPSSEGLNEKGSVSVHQLNSSVQKDVFPLVCCRAVSANEYAVRNQLGDDGGTVARLVALSCIFPDAVTCPHFTNCENDEINLQGAVVEVIEVPTDGHVNIDVLALCSSSLSTLDSPSDSMEWKIEIYRTALRHSRQLELYLKTKEDIVISPTESDDEADKPCQTQDHFSVEVIQDEGSDEGDSDSAAMERRFYECVGEGKLWQHASNFGLGDGTIRRLPTVSGAKNSKREVKRENEVIVVSDDDADRGN